MTTCKECPTCQRRRASKYTAAESVLLAMLRLEANTGLADHDHDAIVVAAWEVAPGIFSMRNFPQYPDSKRVSMEIANGKPLIKQRLVQKTIEPRRYRLTDAGRERARKLEAAASGV